MLIMVKLHEFDNTVDILDTDDGVVETVSYTYATSLNMKIVGLGTYGDFPNKLVMDGMTNSVGWDAVSKPKYTHFKDVEVYWVSPISKDFRSVSGILEINYGSVNFNMPLVRGIAGNSVLGQLVVICAVLNEAMLPSKTDLTINFNNAKYDYRQYGADNLFVLFLAVIMSGVDTLSLSNKSRTFIELKDISVSCIRYKDKVYFTDGICLLVCKEALLNSALDVRQKNLENTKHVMMNTSITVDMVSGDYVVHTCPSLNINNNKHNYVFSYNMHIGTLNIGNIASPRLKISDGITLWCENFCCKADKGAVDKFNRVLAVDKLCGYKVNKDAFSFEFFVRVCKYPSKEVVDFDLLDVNTKDEMVAFCNKVFKAECLDDDLFGSCVWRYTWLKMALINNMHSFNLLPDRIKRILDINNYKQISIHDFIVKYRSLTDCMDDTMLYRYLLPYFNSSRGSYQGAYAIDQFIDTLFSDIYNKVLEKFNKISEVVEITKTKAGFSEDDVYVTVRDNITGMCFSVRDMKEYNACIDFKMTLTEIKKLIYKKFGYSLEYDIDVKGYGIDASVLICGFVNKGVLIYPSRVQLGAIKNIINLMKKGYDIQFNFNSMSKIRTIVEVDKIVGIRIDMASDYKLDGLSINNTHIKWVDISGMSDQELIDSKGFIHNLCLNYDSAFTIKCTKRQANCLYSLDTYIAGRRAVFDIRG